MGLLLVLSVCFALSRATILPTCVKPDVETFSNDSTVILLPQGNKAPVINGIDFTDWILATPVEGVKPVLTPASPPNVIGVGVLGPLLGGEIELHPRASISAVEPVRSFTLTSVSYGCFLNGVTPGGLAATACKIRATAYNLDGKEVSATFNYKPDALTKASMMEEKFKGFEALKNVTFEVIGAGAGLLPLTVPLTMLALDDVALCRHY